MASRWALFLGLLVGLGACGGGSAHMVRRFPLQAPLTVDPDDRDFPVPCRKDESRARHVICTPVAYASPRYWDRGDASLFRPVSRFLAVDPAAESVNVNAFDEVPDSSWFSNRIGRKELTPEEAEAGACSGDTLDPNASERWVLEGKPDGDVFLRAGDRRYLLRTDEPARPERATAAGAIVARFYHAVGYSTACDQVLHFPRERVEVEQRVDLTRSIPAKDEDRLFARATRRGDQYRFLASKELPGKPLGPFRYEGIRKDDANDIIPHEDRRELRGERLLAAWLGHVEARAAVTRTTWRNQDPKDVDASPGHFHHFIVDFHGALAPEGHGKAFESEPLSPERWQPAYPNPAFVRMSERDGAWMARILARFRPEHIARIVHAGALTDREAESRLVQVLVTRQRAILTRWFSVVSPLTDLEVPSEAEGLCATDLARAFGIAPPDAFRYAATVRSGPNLDEKAPAPVVARDGGRLCVALPRIVAAGAEQLPDADPRRYLVVDVDNGNARTPLRAHLYDRGPGHGYALVGVER